MYFSGVFWFMFILSARGIISSISDYWPRVIPRSPWPVYDIPGQFSGRPTVQQKPFNATEDARIILDNGAAPEVLINILGHRTRDQRIQIDAEYKKMNNGVSLNRRTDNAFVTVFCKTDLQYQIIADPFLDIVDVLVETSEGTFIRYLEGAFYTNFDQFSAFKMLTQILVTSDVNKPSLIDHYDKFAGDKHPHVKELVEDQFPDSDWKNFLRSLIKKTREPDRDFNPDEVQKDVDRLLKEKKKKGWDDHRKVLEEVLMERPKNFVRSFLDVYAKSNNNVPLTKDITDKLGHNKFLTFGYLSLVAAAVDMNLYIADRIHGNELISRDGNDEGNNEGDDEGDDEGEDNDDDNDDDEDDNPDERVAVQAGANDQPTDHVGTMTVFIVGYSEILLVDIKASFQKAYNIPMKKYILDLDPGSPVNRMLAAIVGD